MSKQVFESEIKPESELSQILLPKAVVGLERGLACEVNAEAEVEGVEEYGVAGSKRRRECEEGSEVMQMLQQTTQRASYRTISSPPPILLECRILQSASQYKSLRLSTKKELCKGRPCNETKNIAKNYGKAIVAFIHNNRKVFRRICKECSTPYQRVTEELPELKSRLSTVTGFRKVWTEYKYAECIRRVSNLFLRKVALSYIFNSKIDNYKSHIKYRAKFLQSLQNPQNFDHLKDY